MSALLAIGLLACGPAGPPPDPPTVPRLPRVSRVEVDHFDISWTASQSPTLEASEIRYEIGMTDSDYCIIDEPDFVTTGTTEFTARVEGGHSDGPLLAFSVRSVDPSGRSYGYGPCGWGLRSPQRIPIALNQRTPRFGSLDCRPDGNLGAWCLGDGEMGHYSGGYWDIFTLPAFFDVTDWVPLDASDALIRSSELQLHLSRANGVHAYLLSSGNQRFDGAGGAIPTGRERAYVSVRGFIGEFSTYHLDLAGPPRALRLPDDCARVVQMGHAGDMAFALCAVDSGGFILFRGHAEHRLMRWSAPIPVSGDRVASVSGTLASGVAVVTRDDGIATYFWEGDAFREHELDALIVTERPTAAATGSAFAPLVVAQSGDDMIIYDGEEAARPRVLGGRVSWLGVDFPADSQLVGTALGVLAISAEAVVRISRNRAVRLVEHPQSLRGVRGADGRHYLLRGPHLESVASTRTGREWYYHAWRGEALEPIDIAVSRSGSIYLSGYIADGTSRTGRRATVRRLGADATDLNPTDLPFTSAPRLTVDGLGRLYAATDRDVRWYAPATGVWSPRLPLPGEVRHLVGLDEGALIVMEGYDENRDARPIILRCDEMCLNLTVPAAVAQPINSAFAEESGFCIGVQSRALWCREGRQDNWIALTFSAAVADRYGLGEMDTWRIIDALHGNEDTWFVAIETDQDGFIAQVTDGEMAILVATGIRWGQGSVLTGEHTASGLVAFEEGGPVRLRLGTERVAIPGVLY